MVGITMSINIAIVGVGNCASSLIMGIFHYSHKSLDKEHIGLANPIIGGYKISDIIPVVAFDVDSRKVGKDIIDAMISEPNCTKQFEDIIDMKLGTDNLIVMKSPVLDGVADHMKDSFHVDNNQKELTKDEIVSILKKKKTDIIINYLPVGSQKATEFWAEVALESNAAFINCIPVFIASNPECAKKFQDKGIPIVGDDIKSQCGATILHRAIINMLTSRGAKIDSTWQTNVGGNTDFKNMLLESRLVSKKISKTESVSSQIPYDTPVYAGPNGYIESLKDNKICNIRVDFRIFGGVPCSIDCKLSVEDSPNSSGVVVDAIRVAKIAKDRKIGGPITPACAYFMKHPPEQMNDYIARKELEQFISNIHINNQ